MAINGTQKMTCNHIASHKMRPIRRQKGLSLIPALITICVFVALTTKVVIPNQERDLNESNINAVANTAEKLIQASYAFRSDNNTWPSGFVVDPLHCVTANDILDTAYLPYFNNHSPWGKTWKIKSTPGSPGTPGTPNTPGNPCNNATATTPADIYFELETGTGNKAINNARAIVQKIGSYAEVDIDATTKVAKVLVYPATISATATIQNLSVVQDITAERDISAGQDITAVQDIIVGRNIILTGNIMKPSGTILIDGTLAPTGASSPTVTAPAAHTHSSKRFKHNIQPLDMPAESIYQLKPVSFDYVPQYQQYKTNNAAKIEIGLIAEQVLPLAPELILIKDNKVIGVDYQKLSILLLKAIQELKTEVITLQQDNQQLQKQLNSLHKSCPDKANLGGINPVR